VQHSCTCILRQLAHRDVCRVENALFRPYGDESGSIAIRRVDALSEHGNAQGAAVWLYIVDLKDQLRRAGRKFKYGVGARHNG